MCIFQVTELLCYELFCLFGWVCAGIRCASLLIDMIQSRVGTAPFENRDFGEAESPSRITIPYHPPPSLVL